MCYESRVPGCGFRVPGERLPVRHFHTAADTEHGTGNDAITT